MPTISTEYTWEEAEYMDRLYTVEFMLSIYAIPGRPARTRGPPEACYPAEAPDLEAYDIEPVSMFGEKWPKGSKPEVIRPKSLMAAYWLRQFEKEVEPSDDFKEWAWEQVADADPDEDDCSRKDAP